MDWQNQFLPLTKSFFYDQLARQWHEKTQDDFDRMRGCIFSPLLLFLFFVVAFSSLFYFLYDENSSFEQERAQRDLHILSSALQTTLLADEKFFLANIPRAADGG